MRNPLVSKALPNHTAEEDLARALEELVSSGELRSIVTRLAGGDRSELASLDAYQHPNGFVKIRLRSLPNGTILRLHLWPDHTNIGDIHSHRWDFASLIVDGSLLDMQYASIAGSSQQSYRCYPNARARKYSFVAADPIDVHLVTDDLHHQGSFYSQPMHRLHFATAGSGFPATTIVLQGPPQLDHSLVVVDRDMTPEDVVVSQLTVPQIRSALEVVEEKLHYVG